MDVELNLTFISCLSNKKLRHRYVSASAAGMSPLDFSYKLAKMWGAKLIFAPKNQCQPLSQRLTPKEEQLNQQSHANEGSGGQGNVATSAAETTEVAPEAANTPPSSGAAAGDAVPAVINAMETPSATKNAAGSAEKHQLPKVTPSNDDTSDTSNIAVKVYALGT